MTSSTNELKFFIEEIQQNFIVFRPKKFPQLKDFYTKVICMHTKKILKQFVYISRCPDCQKNENLCNSTQEISFHSWHSSTKIVFMAGNGNFNKKKQYHFWFQCSRTKFIVVKVLEMPHIFMFVKTIP